jgi:hypothetical protein
MYTHIFYVDHFVKGYNVSVIKEKKTFYFVVLFSRKCPQRRCIPCVHVPRSTHTLITFDLKTKRKTVDYQ